MGATDSAYMTLREFAALMGCGEEVARRVMASKDHPPAHRVGSRWRISREGADEWRRKVDSRPRPAWL